MHLCLLLVISERRMNLNYKPIIETITLLVALTSICYGQNVTVRLHSIEGYGEHEEFARNASKLLETVLNSDEFRKEVENGKFIKTNNLTKTQLYDRIMLAREKVGEGGEDRVVDLRVRIMDLDGEHKRYKKNVKFAPAN